MKNLSKVNKGNSEITVEPFDSTIALNPLFSNGTASEAAKAGMGSGNGGGSGGGGGVGGGSGGNGGGNGGGSGSGGNNGGSSKGDLFGDQYILLRDLNSADGSGNGEPVLDENGQPILIGSDGKPIYFIADVEGDYEIPPEDLAFTQTVELGRANVARAPSKVMEKSLDAAMTKIEAGTNVTADAAGRIVVDGVTIDSPLENLALYKYLMTAGGESSWPAVVDHWPAQLKALVGSDLLNPDWSPASLLGAAFDKTVPISLDAVLYQDTVLGVNKVTYPDGEMQVDYFDFTDGSVESFNYDRIAYYDDLWLQWYEDTDGDPSNLELVQKNAMEAVFDNEEWSDSYIQVAADGLSFEAINATTSGTNDFAQAVDDARAVINFMHDTGAIEMVEPPASQALMAADQNLISPFTVIVGVNEGHDDHEEMVIMGTNKGDLIETAGGPQSIYSGNGQDMVISGGGPDLVEGGNGKDYLAGEGGPDMLYGGNGDDVIYGGAGPDVLTGGNGYDTFLYQARSDAPARGGESGEDHDGGHGEDSFTMVVGLADEEEMRFEQITDFKPSEDWIHLKMMGITSFSDVEDKNAVWVEQDGLNTLVYVDLNGEIGGGNPAEMEITLVGVNTQDISAANFLF
jgi:Ca2+-binding RTX toxin-like protein